MKPMMLAAATLGLTIVATPSTASAQAWQPINQRQAQLDRRIDVGVRNGQLTRAEARRLRTEFRQIAQLEYRYRRTAPGLTRWERRDLDRRMDQLSRRVRFERRDRQSANRWVPINRRQAQLDRRIDVGVRNGALTRPEAVRLRAQFRQIARLEYRYRRTGGGLTVWERRDLDRRMDRLSRQIRLERRDRNRRPR